MSLGATETVLYIGSMICVGFLEEVIFRGLLFRAMEKDSVKAAVIVSSVTFGIGHIVNLFNGSGADLVANLCQVCYATAFGFLCVIIFYRGGSLVPCIITHSVVNALSVFSLEPHSVTFEIVTAVLLTVIAGGYAFVLMYILPNTKNCTNNS